MSKSVTMTVENAGKKVCKREYLFNENLGYYLEEFLFCIGPECAKWRWTFWGNKGYCGEGGKP